MNLDARLRRMERARDPQRAPGVVIIYDATAPHAAEAQARAARGTLITVYLPDNHREPTRPVPTPTRPAREIPHNSPAFPCNVAHPRATPH